MTSAAANYLPARAFISSRAFIFAAIFCVGLCLFEIVLLPPSLETVILVNHLENGNYLRLLLSIGLSAASIVLALVFYCLAFASSWPCRIVFFLIFAFITFVEYTHFYAFARFSDFHNAAVGLFVGDWKFVSDAIRMYLNPVALLPISVFGVLLIFSRRVIPGSFRPLAAFALSVLVFFATTSYFTRNTFYLPSTTASMRTAIALPVIWYAGTINGAPRSVHYATPRPPLGFRSDGIPANNIVLIIDESVRGDYLSVNGFGKPTTPYLEELSRTGYVANWGIATAGSTCSSGANNLLLTGLTELPDYDFNLLKMPTMFQFARAMNYKTYYLDGQVSNIWNGKISDKADFGDHITVDQLRPQVANEYDIDREVAGRIRSVVAGSYGNFIWVNKSGVHKPYAAKYPGGSSGTDGWSTSYGIGTNRADLVRDYEQAITYNSKLFFSELFSEGIPPRTFFIYTSDHGQTLQENGEVASHCTTSRTEAIVPLMIIADDARVRAADVTYKASHSNIFPTVLDLMSVPDSERRERYALSLLTATGRDSLPRFYMAGDLHGVGSTKRYAFD